MRVDMMLETEIVTTPLLQAEGTVRDSERELIFQAKSGSTSAFEQLVERFETRIFRIVQRITNHYQDSEDVVQNAFLKAFRNLPRFRGDSSFYTWLVRIAVNESIMTLRRRRFNEFSIDEACEFDEISIPREIKDWGPNPEQLYSQHELQGILTTAISELKPGYRTIFQLLEIEGLSTKETAQVLDLSVSAVKVRRLRARIALRNSLDKYFCLKGAGTRHPIRRSNPGLLSALLDRSSDRTPELGGA